MSNPFSAVIGQNRAVDQLMAAVKAPVHAYLFVGPAGCGKRMAARAFAAALLRDDRPLTDTHPDVVIVEREGASINVAQAREIGRLAARSPVEGGRKVLVLTDFHLVGDAAPALLKTIEEASPSTIFVILADSLPRELVTVASRCVRIDFCALAVAAIEQQLITEGIDSQRAHAAADAASGSLDRARLLAVDDSVVERRELWRSLLARADGTGHTAALLVDEIIASLDHAMAPLEQRQADEKAQSAVDVKEKGRSGTAVKDLEAKHKREQRRLRTDELRSGLAQISAELSVRMQSAQGADDAAAVSECLDAVTWANQSLTLNPNEQLLLMGLCMRLSSVPGLRRKRVG